MSWLQTQVEHLQLQVEQAEAEVESLQGNVKKRGKTGTTTTGRLEELEHLNERRKWHISRLEIVLRLLNNGSLTPERVWGLKEDVSYFVESNTVCRTGIGVQPSLSSHRLALLCRRKTSTRTKVYMTIFTLMKKRRSLAHHSMTMIAMNRTWAVKVGASYCFACGRVSPIIADLPPRTPKKHDEESPANIKRDDSPILKKAPVTLQLRSEYTSSYGACDVNNLVRVVESSIAAESTNGHLTPSTPLTTFPTTAKPPPNPNFAQQPMASILKAGLPPAPRPPAILPPIRYAAAAAAAVAPPSAALNPPPQTPITLQHPAAASHPPLPVSPSAPLIPPSQSQARIESHEQLSVASSSSPSLTHPSATSPMLSSSASVSHQPDDSFYSGLDSPALSEDVSSELAEIVAESPVSRKGARGLLWMYRTWFSQG